MVEPKDVDWTAVACVLAAGEIFGDDAPLTDSPVPDFGFDPLQCVPDEIFPGTARDAQGECDALVRKALRDLGDSAEEGGTALGLSGGRDSRHIALAAREEQVRIHRYVVSPHWIPGPSDADVEAARALAKRLEVRLEVLERGHDRYAAEWRKNSLTGLQTLNHSWALPMADALRGGGTLLDGLNGGGLFGRDPLTTSWIQSRGPSRPSPAEAEEHTFQHVIAHGRRRVRRWLQSPRIDEGTWHEVDRRFRRRFERYRDLPNPFQAWWILERARRGTSLLPMVLIGGRRTIAPYFTADMLRFALSLPWDVGSQAEFQEAMVAAAYPDCLDIPYAHEIVRGRPADARPGPDLSLDHASEESSWRAISRALTGHVRPAFLASRQAPSDTGRGNRRMVLLAQALEWEAGNAREQP